MGNRISLARLILAAVWLAGCALERPPRTPPIPPPAKATPAVPPTRLPSTGAARPTLPVLSPEAATATTQPLAATSGRPARPQLGVNFIRFFWGSRAGELDRTTPYLQPDTIFADFKALGVQAYRQFVQADLYWDVVEPRDNVWNFQAADAVIPNAEFEPIVGLFRMQYASPTPPWAAAPAEFQKTLGPEAVDYLTTVVTRYAPYVKYWEIGNEMAYWKAGDPAAQTDGAGLGNAEEQLPAAHPADGFSPREQGVFLAQAAALIRQLDADAVIVAPALPALSDYDLQTWLPGVVAGGGADWFDVVNYHFYSGWERHTLWRPALQQTLRKLGLDQKPVWLTETGLTSSATLTVFTDYPNSPEEQAADVFRRAVQGWGLGDAFVVWHTYLDSSETVGNWRAFGLRTSHGETQLAYAAFQLLSRELVPFEKVEALATDPRGVNAYRITTAAGAVKYVVWGAGRYPVPAGVAQQTSVVPAAAGAYTWQPAAAELTLTARPVLLK